METFTVTAEAIIDVEFPVKCQVDQEDLMLLDEESYHQIISFQRDRGAICSAVERSIEMEEGERSEEHKKAILFLKKVWLQG